MSIMTYCKHMSDTLVENSLFIYNLEAMPQVKKLTLDFAKLCLELRAKQNWTQQQMADYLSTPLRSYQRWEYGTVKPNADAAYKLAQLNFFLQLEQIVKENFNPL
jgi:DNA-binding transcriptional regulator YiaG